MVEAKPPRTFSFRWTHPQGEPATEDNSNLVTFDLTPSGDGTMLRFTETGLRTVEEHQDHVSGWDHFLPRLVSYAPTIR